ncbi:predicted protein [Sclerotinia sclerotiorum 1980 UF-70]|uniref:Uncharacterized protein n=1 Tax=Sclerotinia sclerotiorum (strain ATCC 18683 / 1980 / Ss-1) TaxID=665079 RepID=A7EDA5_SCLS1|nr:predicted protein [Sclerotinia sclerotiorum 1980 UF-70]EDO00821.1 predicted protein [Sclerotinia sclerotiorum 1980 UF-70]
MSDRLIGSKGKETPIREFNALQDLINGVAIRENVSKVKTLSVPHSVSKFKRRFPSPGRSIS